MDYRSSLSRAIGIVNRDKSAVEAVARDPKASLPGLVVVFSAGFLSTLPQGIEPAAGALIVAPVSFCIGIAVLFVTAKIFGGDGGYMELWRPHAYASILMMMGGVFRFVPGIGALLAGVAGIYLLIVSVIIVETTQHLRRGAAVGVVLTPYVAVLAALVIASGGSALGPFIYTIF